VHNGNSMVELEAASHLHISPCAEHTLKSPEKETM
jgi:hypothetical protein